MEFLLLAIAWLFVRWLRRMPRPTPPTITITITEVRDDRRPPPEPRRGPLPKHEPEILAAKERRRRERA
jgi:hypothetical protein